MPRHQLSITAGQIDSKIAEAQRRLDDGVARFGSISCTDELEHIFADIDHALRDKQAWMKVSDAYAQKFA